MPTRRYSASVQIADRTLSGSATLTESGVLSIEEAIAGNATDLEIQLPLGDASGIKGLFILANRNMTLKVNASTAEPANLSLLANQPFVWYEGIGAVLVIGDTILDTLDVQRVFVTNGAVAGTLEIDALFDVTP